MPWRSLEFASDLALLEDRIRLRSRWGPKSRVASGTHLRFGMSPVLLQQLASPYRSQLLLIPGIPIVSALSPVQATLQSASRFLNSLRNAGSNLGFLRDGEERLPRADDDERALLVVGLVWRSRRRLCLLAAHYKIYITYPRLALHF